MSVAVSPPPSGLAFGVPRALFRMPVGRSFGVGEQSYAVSRDGQRFLVLAWPGEAASSPIAVVLGPSAHGASQP